MKRWLLLIFAVLLVLSGCDGEPVPETTQTLPPQTMETTQATEPPPSLYVPDSRVEQDTKGAVCLFLPETGKLSTYDFMGDDPVLIGWAEDMFDFVRIDADTGEILAQGTVTGTVDVWSGLVFGQDGFVCWDVEGNQLLFYDGQIRLVDTLPIPEEIQGSVLITEDMSTAYYGINGTIMALDLHTGISRLVAQIGDVSVYATNLLFDDTVVCCYVSSEYDSYDGFFSLTDGRLLAAETNYMGMETRGDFFVAQYTDGPVMETLVGTRNGEMKSFQTENRFSNLSILPRSGRLLESVATENGMELRLYDQAKGHCLGKVLLRDTFWAGTVREDVNGCIWTTATDSETETEMLCRWDPTGAQGADEVVRLGYRYTANNPDLEGIAQCELRAQEMGERYGVEICLYKDFVEPFDYSFVPEYQVSAILDALDALEAAMSKFPEGFFKTAATITEDEKFYISLVRSMIGVEYNTISDVSGLHYWIEGNSYICLQAREGIEQNFYHELCHALETYIIVNSIHYDFWEDNNPKDFTYDYSYTEYTERWDSPWLQDETRAFIDAYSMTYPIEDRARILEYAITEGNESYFTTDTMQAKLKQLCMAIREAFGWEKSQEAFLWEQYLQEPLQRK